MSIALNIISTVTSYGALGFLTGEACDRLWKPIDPDGGSQKNLHPHVTIALKIVAFIGDIALIAGCLVMLSATHQFLWFLPFWAEVIFVVSKAVCLLECKIEGKTPKNLWLIPNQLYAGLIKIKKLSLDYNIDSQIKERELKFIHKFMQLRPGISQQEPEIVKINDDKKQLLEFIKKWKPKQAELAKIEKELVEQEELAKRQGRLEKYQDEKKYQDGDYLQKLEAEERECCEELKKLPDVVSYFLDIPEERKTQLFQPLAVDGEAAPAERLRIGEPEAHSVTLPDAIQPGGATPPGEDTGAGIGVKVDQPVVGIRRR